MGTMPEVTLGGGLKKVLFCCADTFGEAGLSITLTWTSCLLSCGVVWCLLWCFTVVATLVIKCGQVFCHLVVSHNAKPITLVHCCETAPQLRGNRQCGDWKRIR